MKFNIEDDLTRDVNRLWISFILGALNGPLLLFAIWKGFYTSWLFGVATFSYLFTLICIHEKARSIIKLTSLYNYSATDFYDNCSALFTKIDIYDTISNITFHVGLAAFLVGMLFSLY